MGYSRKYPPPPPPPWTTPNWVPKNFRISKKDNCSFCRIPEPADSKSWGIPEFCKNLNGFPGIPVKIYKILGKFVDFQSYSLSISYRISNVVHGGCVDIFWNSPMYPPNLRLRLDLMLMLLASRLALPLGSVQIFLALCRRLSGFCFDLSISEETFLSWTTLDKFKNSFNLTVHMHRNAW